MRTQLPHALLQAYDTFGNALSRVNYSTGSVTFQPDTGVSVTDSVIQCWGVTPCLATSLPLYAAMTVEQTHACILPS